MSEPQQTPLDPTERVGFRDIYRAVGESEGRIKEHITLVLLPITAQVAETTSKLAALDVRVQAVEAWQQNDMSAGKERRRIGDLSGRAVAAVVLVANFILGLIVMFSNLITDHAR